MNDNDKRVPFFWSLLAGMALWVFSGFLFYSLGLMARAALAR